MYFFFFGILYVFLINRKFMGFLYKIYNTNVSETSLMGLGISLFSRSCYVSLYTNVKIAAEKTYQTMNCTFSENILPKVT